MEKINIKSDTTAARFLHVAASKADNAGLRRSMQGKLLAVVTFQINGITVPFEAVLDQMAREHVQQVDRLALEKAELLVTESGMEAALGELRDARMAVRRALQTVREKAPA